VNKQRPFRLKLGAMCLALAFSLPAVAAKDLPASTTDGLVLKKQTEGGAVYLREDASFAAYDKVAVSDVMISFKKDWLRDHNRNIRSPANRVTDQDMVAIKEKMAEEFYAVFEKELNAGGFPTTNSAAADVLLVQPNIINLDIFAPTVNPASRANTYAGATGEMTLVLELYDSVSGAIMARAIDFEVVGENDLGHMASRSANLAAYNETLEGWAKRLVKALDRAKSTGAN